MSSSRFPVDDPSANEIVKWAKANGMRPWQIRQLRDALAVGLVKNWEPRKPNRYERRHPEQCKDPEKFKG